MPEATETGLKWWMRYIIVPLIGCVLGGGGAIALYISYREHPTITPPVTTPSDAQTPGGTAKTSHDSTSPTPNSKDRSATPTPNPKDQSPSAGTIPATPKLKTDIEIDKSLNEKQIQTLESKGDSFLRAAISTKKCLIDNCFSYNAVQRKLDENRVSENMSDAMSNWQQALRLSSDADVVWRLSKKLAGLGYTCNLSRPDPCYENGTTMSHVYGQNSVDDVPDIRGIN
jgi:hypothetical protein